MAGREDRGSLTHYEFKPTGYYLESFNTYTVTLNSDLMDNELEKIKLSIGQWGQYKDINQNKNYVFSHFVILTKVNSITFTLKNDGVLYLADNNQTDLQVIKVISKNDGGIIKISTFKLNKTNKTDFIKQVNTTNSPFVEFVARNYFATMQT